MASKNDSTPTQATTVSATQASPQRFTHSPSTKTNNDDARGELTAQLEDLLNTLSNKFAGVSSEIFAKSRFPSRLSQFAT